MNPNAITELDVDALIDSELTMEQETLVRLEMDKNPYLKEHYRQMMAQKRLLRAYWEVFHETMPVT